VADLEDLDKDLKLFDRYPPPPKKTTPKKKKNVEEDQPAVLTIVLHPLSKKRMKNSSITSFFGSKK